MADQELARILASQDYPVSSHDRELAARKRKQPGASDNGELPSILAGSRGGIGSDARMPVAPVQRDPALERQIQVWTMSGRQPTPEMDAYLRAIAPEKMERSERLAGRDTPLVPYLPAELGMIPQMGRAGQAIGKAYEDPSIPSVTNAGVQTSLAALRPLTGLKVLGAGYGAALADDLGAFDSMSAEAQQAKKGAPSKALPGLLPAQQAEFEALEKKIGTGDFGSPADRRMAIERHRELRSISDRFSTDKNAGAQAEYARRGEAAEAAFKREMARDKRFEDSTVGKLFEETAGVTPFLVAAGTGALTRSSMKPSFASNYGIPAGLGAAEGAIVANAPLGTNAYMLPPAYNPARAGYEAGARELPADDPRRAEWLANAEREPMENPVRAQASKDFEDPWKMAKRTGFGIAEGVAGGIVGAKVPAAIGRAYDGARSLLGRSQARPEVLPPTSTTLADTLAGTGTPSRPSTAGAMTSGATRPATATGSGANDELAQILAQGRLPAPASVPNSDDLLRALSSPANRNVSKSAEVKRGKDKLGRPYAKDPDDGRFTPDPDK